MFRAPARAVRPFFLRTGVLSPHVDAWPRRPTVVASGCTIGLVPVTICLCSLHYRPAGLTLFRRLAWWGWSALPFAKGRGFDSCVRL